ncbi:hypothetical protein [Rhodopseudomonas sp. BR0M22]|uniref:hypothetical protein n=1 Tax=Rhodopseudomonas sp. BR0M22 TaxID=2269369 RepID=UPI0013DFAFB3|nr:hypothetical protein [Rhodopseudomonas sp. BR0M22]
MQQTIGMIDVGGGADRLVGGVGVRFGYHPVVLSAHATHGVPRAKHRLSRQNGADASKQAGER